MGRLLMASAASALTLGIATVRQIKNTAAALIAAFRRDRFA